MGARRARLRPGHPRPRPRPLPRSPPLPQGWGRPLPGPRGCLPRLPRRGTDIDKMLSGEKNTFYCQSGRQGGAGGSGLGSGAVQGAAVRGRGGGGPQAPGEPCAGEKGESGESPSPPLPAPAPPPPLSPSPPPPPPCPAEPELQDLAGFHGARCFYRRRLDRPEGEHRVRVSGGYPGSCGVGSGRDTPRPPV